MLLLTSIHMFLTEHLISNWCYGSVAYLKNQMYPINALNYFWVFSQMMSVLSSFS